VAQLAEAGIRPADDSPVDMSEADTSQQGWYTVSELRLLYTPNGNPYILAKGLSDGEPFPNLQKHGVMCWPEVYESVLGSADQLKVTPGVGEPIPVPPTASRMLVQFKPNKSNGMSPNRVIRFAEA